MASKIHKHISVFRDAMYIFTAPCSVSHYNTHDLKPICSNVSNFGMQETVSFLFVQLII